MSNTGVNESSYNYCALPLAVYACRPDRSRGRVFAEPDSRHRSAFQRDRDRIIHASAFRRLKGKTQVFVHDEGDHYRTRLTHTLEVAQITRSIARALMVNEDLAEGVALAHDLGHTPFAHIGEEYLNICMKPYGGFNHNDQSLRVLTTLERKYPGWNGLNLSWETLEGVVKHNGPHRDGIGGGTPFVAVADLQKRVDLQLGTHASLEAQVAALSDDIAYNNHDVEDGLRAQLFSIKDLQELPLLGEVLQNVREHHGALDRHYLVQEMIREMIGAMVEDVLLETESRLKDVAPKDADDIRMAGVQIVSFSENMREKVDALRAFLFERMYRHYTMNRMWLKVERIVTDLFTAFTKNYKVLPDNWQRRVEEAGGADDPAIRARIVADYIAGMTDRYAIREHERLFDLYWDMK
ncbi:MAG: deoxyguanosinetriphosphate triphosphohydrolase [Alphaproteobacteria bacterium]|nr:deoxyguanosinetriphosphate triphosphohydrolase [Alphaproteobacteria bacterium]